MNNEDNWSDEECRFFLQLCTAEKKKGNKTKTGLNIIGKESIIKQFEEKFGKRYTWDKQFKNKYDTCRRAYGKIKNLLHNRTGITYDSMGRILMSDDWWSERIREWPEAIRYKNKLIPNMDVFREEFCPNVVTGAEGWSAQQGETSLDSRVGAENDDEADSFVVPPPPPQAVGSQFRAGSSVSKRKRKEIDTATDTCSSRNTQLFSATRKRTGPKWMVAAGYKKAYACK